MAKQLLFLSLLLVLGGCSKGGDSGAPHNPQIEVLREPKPSGSYQKDVEKIKNGYQWEKCDEDLQSLRMEVAIALDQKQDPNAPPISKEQAHKSATTVQIGSFSFRKSNTTLEDLYWEKEIDNWESIKTLYKKSTEENNPADWALLESTFSYVLSNDYYRLVNEINFGFLPSDEEKALALVAQLEKCQETNLLTCLQRHHLDFIETVTFFRRWWNDVLSKEDAISQWKRFLTFRRDVNTDVQFKFLPELNKGIRRVGNTFIVPLKTKDFKSIQAELKDIIEAYWKFETFKVLVEWSDSPDAFEIQLGAKYNARPYVNTYKKIMVIHEGNRLGGIAHELGHILGIPDQYFDVFNSSTCGYEYHWEVGNIMSDTTTGRVLKKHFEMLNKLYPDSSGSKISKNLKKD
ncbi:MAG: hypothetical protein AB7F59_14975 [Bdellovibrionales bacterium]